MTKKISRPRRSVKELLADNASNLKSGVFTRAKQSESTKKPAKPLTKKQQDEKKRHRKNVIMGLGLLFVVASIAYSTSVVTTFVDSQQSLILLAPQVAFAIITIFKAFSKLYK